MSTAAETTIGQPTGRPSIAAWVSAPAATLHATTSAQIEFRFGMVLVAIIFLSAFPSGGNYPILWMFWAVCFSTALSIGTLRNSARMRALWAQHWPYLSVGILLVGVAVAQTLIPRTLLSAVVLGPGEFQVPTGSLSPLISIAASFRIVSSTMFFFLCLWAFSDPRNRRKVAMLVLTAIAMHAAIGLIAQPPNGDMATGPFANHTTYASFLGLGLVLGVSLMLFPQVPKIDHPFQQRILISLGVVVILIALLATQSRMGIVATVMAALIPCAYAAKTRSRPLLFGAVLLGVIGLFGTGFLDRLVWIPVAGQTRLALYSQVLELVAARPFIGFGADAFPMAFEMVHRPPVSAEFIWNRAHSTYLGLWGEYGVVFGSLPILGGLAISARLIRNIRQPNQDRALPIAALAALCLAALHSTIDFSFEIQANAFLLLGIIALGLASSRPQTAGKGTLTNA